MSKEIQFYPHSKKIKKQDLQNKIKTKKSHQRNKKINKKKKIMLKNSLTIQINMVQDTFLLMETQVYFLMTVVR